MEPTNQGFQMAHEKPRSPRSPVDRWRLDCDDASVDGFVLLKHPQPFVALLLLGPGGKAFSCEQGMGGGISLQHQL